MQYQSPLPGGAAACAIIGRPCPSSSRETNDMPCKPLALFKTLHFPHSPTQLPARPAFGRNARRQLRQLLAIACANDMPDEKYEAQLLELNRRLRPVSACD
ncbi:hypothetical protein [Tahibacter aquaticus]|uniref:hypothetical protein n=1 Tax=Tahibacter aquaticus TaxID=520092 RepID=UPI001061C109|nr:hypothetical protein [Tahibacter aquaticus]